MDLTFPPTLDEATNLIEDFFGEIQQLEEENQQLEEENQQLKDKIEELLLQINDGSIRIYDPDGRGAHFDRNGNFIGFIERQYE